MSTSVINSARSSASSLFGVVDTTAQAATQLVNTATRAISALDKKAEYFHRSVIVSTELRMSSMVEEEIASEVTRHVDAMEEFHRRNYPDSPFNRQAYVEATIKRLNGAVAALDEQPNLN